jgi:hypothetical protein
VIHNQGSIERCRFYLCKNWSSFDDYAAMPEVKEIGC